MRRAASRAALCAGQQTMFWEMHDILFDWQTRYGNTAFSQNRLLAGVEQLGLITNAFTNCFNSAATSATLSAAQSEDVSSTPTIRVNGVTLDQGGAIPSTQVILQAIDDATPAEWGQASALTQTAAPTDSATQTSTAETVAVVQPTAADTATSTPTSDALATGAAATATP